MRFSGQPEVSFFDCLDKIQSCGIDFHWTKVLKCNQLDDGCKQTIRECKQM